MDSRAAIERVPVAEPAAELLLELRGVSKVYGEGEAQVRALDNVDLSIRRGELVAITGASGSGKSTVLNILGCLDRPSSGEYLIEGVPVQSLPGDILATLRNRRFGFVFQSYNLLRRTSALDNVALPLVYGNVPKTEQQTRAREALASVGLTGRERAYPNQLSGGQQQRVAIARALVNSPEVILADEPTGNLDSKMGAEIMAILVRLNEERCITIVMVTHDLQCAQMARRRIVFRDGRIASDTST